MNMNPKSLWGAARLLKSLSRGNGLEELVEIGYELLGNPILVTDISMKLLAMNKNSEVDKDKIWNEFSRAGYMSHDSVSFYMRKGLIEKMERVSEPFIWDDNYTYYRRIMGKVLINNKSVGAVAVIEAEKPFCDTDLELVSVLCDAVSSEIQKNKFFHYTRGFMYEEFILELLEGKVRNRKVIEERSKYLNLMLKENLFVLTIDITGYDGTHNSFTYMRSILEKMVRNSKAVIYDDRIVLVITCGREDEFIESTCKDIKGFLKGNNITGGLSRCFQNLADLQEHFEQSRDAIRLGSHTNSKSALYLYDDYVLYQIPHLCSENNLNKLCHPALFKLMEHDRKNSTSFTMSLCVYLENQGNITNASNQLHIHRNTMIYRLEKIQELTGINLGSNDTLLHLQLSVKLLEYDKRIIRNPGRE